MQVQIPYMASRQELHEAATLARVSSSPQATSVLPKQLELRLQDERGLWTVALEQSEAEAARALQSLSEQLQRQVVDAVDIAVRLEAQMAGLESRVSMALSELDVRQQAERTERGSDLVAVRGDLDRQWEELSKGLAAAVTETEARAQKDKRELLDALAAVCSDIEALRKQQKEYPSFEQIMENCRDLQEPLQQSSSSMRSEFGRISSEVHELQLQQARLRGNLEQSLRDELQSFVVDELQVRRLNELEVLQAEDSRHRADIDALRDKQNVILEAMRQEEAMKREASEAKCFCELQAVKQQLANTVEAISKVPPLQISHADAAIDSEAVFERLLQDLREECGVLGERLGEDVAQLRAQLAQGIGEVRTAQVKQEGDFQILRSTWDSRWEEFQAEKEEVKPEVEDSEAPVALYAGPSVQDFQAIQQKHESYATEMKHRLSMQTRDIEELQRQVLDSLRDLGAVKRLSLEVEGLRQERQRDRQDLANLLDVAQRDAGEWSIFKAFGCKAEKAPDRPSEDPLERQVCQQPSNMATMEELELLRSKQRQEAQELRSQQRSFFDEVLDQQAAKQEEMSSELEAVRSHCNAAIAGFHSHQTNTVEVLRQQQ